MNTFFPPLFVSVPPQKPVIYDARRRDRTKLIEPYNEGSDVTLICEVSGGSLASLYFLFQQPRRDLSS